MNQQEQQAAYIKIARDTQWVPVVDVKVFDTTQTSIVRVFQHSSGTKAVYAASSTDGKTSKVALGVVLHSVPESITALAAEAGVVAAARDQAIEKLAA